MHQDKKKPNGLAFFGAILARFWRDSLELWYNYLKMYSPKYTISDKILNSISEIEAIRSKISDSHILPTREAEMRYRATVEAAHSSTSIEGNPLNIKQVGVVLSGEPLLSHNEYAEIEVKNYKDALDYISKYDQKKITASTILKIHSLLTNRLLDASRSGKWRKNPVYIENQAGETIYTAVAPQDIPDKINDLLSWLRDNIVRVHPVIVAAILHQELVTIHPFADGNGRTARALTALFLKTVGYDFRGSLVLDSYYSTDRAAYYQALHDSQGATFNASRDADLSSWIEYFTGGFLSSARVLEVEVKLLSSAVPSKAIKEKFTKPEIDLISYATQFGSLDISEAENILPDIPKRTLQRVLKNLVDRGVFKVDGSARNTKYLIHKS